MTPKTHNKILLTGAAGGLGKALREPLKLNCNTLRLSDISSFGEAGNNEEIILADLANSQQVHTILDGVDAVVHMGGISVEGPFGPILQANILGAYNLYEAARMQRRKTNRLCKLQSRHGLLLSGTNHHCR